MLNILKEEHIMYIFISCTVYNNRYRVKLELDHICLRASTYNEEKLKS